MNCGLTVSCSFVCTAQIAAFKKYGKSAVGSAASPVKRKAPTSTKKKTASSSKKATPAAKKKAAASAKKKPAASASKKLVKPKVEESDDDDEVEFRCVLLAFQYILMPLLCADFNFNEDWCFLLLYLFVANCEEGQERGALFGRRRTVGQEMRQEKNNEHGNNWYCLQSGYAASQQY